MPKPSAMSLVINTRINLPRNFRRADFLTFHQRDGQMLAEIVTGNQLQKGIVWQGMPACITFQFTQQQVNISLQLDSGRKKVGRETTQKGLLLLAQHMLGLNQSIALFEKSTSTHPQLATLIAKQSGLRVPQTASTFEALTWAITGQQISVAAAVSLRRKLIQRAGMQHSSGIWCYPDPAAIAVLDEADLRAQGFSQTKAGTVIELANLIHSGQLPIQQWLDDYWQRKTLAAQEIYDKLIQVRGVGSWTINYTLLRGFGWLDGSLHGDVAVRRNLQRLLNQQKPMANDEKITETFTEDWLTGFSPWRALVAAHLWAMQKPEG